MRLKKWIHLNCALISFTIYLLLFVGEYRLLLKYAIAAGERKKSCSIVYMLIDDAFSSNWFIQKELNTLNWYAFSSFIIYTLNAFAWSFCRLAGMWLNWISLDLWMNPNAIIYWFTTLPLWHVALDKRPTTDGRLLGRQEILWRSLIRRLHYTGGALQWEMKEPCASARKFIDR